MRCFLLALLAIPVLSLAAQAQTGPVAPAASADETAARAVTIAGRSIEAPPREVDLLEHLLRRCGHVVTKAALENSLYAMDAEVTPNALEAVVSRLRKRLAAAQADVTIRTVHGVGYAPFAPEDGNA